MSQLKTDKLSFDPKSGITVCLAVNITKSIVKGSNKVIYELATVAHKKPVVTLQIDDKNDLSFILYDQDGLAHSTEPLPLEEYVTVSDDKAIFLVTTIRPSKQNKDRVFLEISINGNNCRRSTVTGNFYKEPYVSLSLGSDTAGRNHTNMTLGELLVYGKGISPNEIKKLYNAHFVPKWVDKVAS